MIILQTAVSAFRPSFSGNAKAYAYRSALSETISGEYGAFFMLPVQAWKASYLRWDWAASAEYWFIDESSISSHAPMLTSSNVTKAHFARRKEEDPIEVFGFLFRDSSSGDLKIKYGVVSQSGGIIFQSSGSDIPIETGTSVASGFTNLYTTTNKLSFAALPDQLFFAQGGEVYNASLTATAIINGTNRRLNSVTFGIGSAASLPLSSGSSDGQTTGPPAITFTGITAIDVLKFADTKFYLALGDPADNSNTGKVVVFEGTDSTFADISQTFEVKGGATEDWFGWSVKLQLLDKDGGAAVSSPEPVLFVGAPKASSGAGYVKVFDIEGAEIQTLPAPASMRAFGYSVAGGMKNTRQGTRNIDPSTMTKAEIEASANPFNITESVELVENYLFVGAPESYSGQGAAFSYKWNNGGDSGSYALEKTIRATPVSSSHRRHFGASVGYTYYTPWTSVYLYVVSYNNDHTSTAVSAFRPSFSGNAKAYAYRSALSETISGEYGAFFMLPVQAWKASYLRWDWAASAEYWFIDESSISSHAPMLTSSNVTKAHFARRKEEDPIEVFGFLFRDSSSGDLKIKYGVVSQSGGIIFQSSGSDIPIETGTSVASGFTNLYTTTNKLSFAALPDQLFFAQGGEVYNASLTATAIINGTNRRLNSVTFGIGSAASLPLSSGSSDGQTTGPPAITFTGITAIDVLKFADTKFYLALGDPADNSNTGKVVVFEGTDSTFADISQTFEVKGGATEDWFGWSVKLQLLDKDGGAAVSSPEPVLFVGAPKASSGAGYVKVFDIEGAEIQTLPAPASMRAFGYSVAGGMKNTRQGTRNIDPSTMTKAEIEASANPFNITESVELVENYLFVGAPESYSGQGAAFSYKWNNGGDSGSYALEKTIRATPVSSSHRRHFGASVGYTYYTPWTSVYLYVVSYNNDHTSTAVSAFRPSFSGNAKAYAYRSALSETISGEYGAFFMLPVQAWKASYLRWDWAASAEYWFIDESSISSHAPMLTSSNVTKAHFARRKEEDPIEVFGFLFRDSSSGDLKIKYGVVSQSGGIIFQSSGSDIPIETGTSVASGFTNLYTTTNKLSFAALPDQLFFAQGGEVYNASLTATAIINGTNRRLNSVTFGIGSAASLPLSSGSSDGQTTGPPAITFTGITAIDVLKFADTKFYLALGDPADNSNTGKVVVFEGTDSTFADISQTFEVKGGATEDWFGWSVKLQLLDKDGGAAVSSPEPVLFVGAPKASSGAGYVKVFDIEGAEIQTLPAPASMRAFGYSVAGGMKNTRQGTRNIDPSTMTKAEIEASANPFNITESVELVENYLFVGAPESYSGQGAAFSYKWNNGGDSGSYALEKTIRATPVSSSHRRHFGASVGYTYYTPWTSVYLYVVSYNNDHTSTAVSAFRPSFSGNAKAYAYRSALSETISGEYGAFFMLPVQAWKASYLRWDWAASAEYWFIDESSISSHAPMLTSSNVTKAHFARRKEEDPIEVFGFLFRDSSSGDLKIKYGVVSQSGGIIFQSSGSDIPIETGTSVASGFTNLYTTTNKLSFAALPDQLFFAQGGEVYNASLTATAIINGTNRRLNSVTFGIGSAASLPLSSGSSDGQTTGPPAITFTGITAIDVLKFADTKFYLALGDPADNSNTGKVVVFEGTDSTFADISQTFEVKGGATEDWFGWSVKLQLLDKDGGAAVSSPEPVLFVGAPKASSGAGYVKVFDIEGAEIQTLPAPASMRAFGYSVAGGMKNTRQGTRNIDPSTMTKAEIEASANPFNITESVELVENYLFVGAPESYSGQGAAFSYKWNNGGDSGSYALEKTIRATPVSSSHRRHFGASVGYTYYTPWTSVYLYVVSYNNDHTSTAVSAFRPSFSGNAKAYAYRSALSETISGEYGAFFMLPVQAWKASYLRWDWAASAEYWFIDESSISSHAPMLTSSNVTKAHFARRKEEDPIEVFGFLFRDSSSGDLKIKYGVVSQSGGIIFQSSGSDIPIETGTSVASGFTNLYTTTNKLSFAALPDQLFFAQGGEVYNASLTATAIINGTNRRLNSVTFGIGSAASLPLSSGSSDGQTTTAVKVEMKFTQMTAVSILKVADDKFWVAVGDPGDNGNTGKVVVFEGADDTLSDLEHKFEFTGGAAGDWFGWSVKLQLLDRDGDTATLSPEPVLFVGAPKANGEKGLVKTMALNPDTYKTNIPLPLGIPTFTYSDGDISVGAFGYSLQTITYNEDNFLIVGAPETQGGEGAVFFYKLDTTNRKFALQQAFFVGNKTGLTTGVSVKMKNVDYNKHFGAEVGAFVYDRKLYFYATSHNDVSHTGTALHFFQRQDNSAISQFLLGDQPYGEVYDAAEYGAFFILPVQLWSLTYQNITEWYKTEAEAEEAKSGIGGTIASDSMDVFALLKLDGSLTIKPFSRDAGRQGFIALSGEEFDIGASLPTDLADGFTRLYAPSKVSILSWENRLFVVQGTGIKMQAFSSTVLLNPFVTSLNIASRASQVNTLTLTSADEQVPVISGEESSGFTKITAISVLRTTDKFYLALGDPAGDATIGKVVVFEGTDSGFSDIEQTFRVEGDIGEWFGWSVKLQLLDRDGAGSVNAPEPVLFVGAPKANSGVGYVKVFAFDETQTVIQTLTPAGVTAPVIKAFGYSLDAKSHPLFRFSHLIVGAPETNGGKGAIFIYRWQDRQYVLKGVFAIEATPTGVSGSQVTLKDGAYNKHFGAEVGAFYFDSTFPRFYAVSYDSGHTGTSIQFFFSNASGGTTREIGAYSTVYSGVEYGSFFTIPVKVWKIESSFRGGTEEFFASREEAIKRSLVLLGQDEKPETSVKTVSLDILGVLKREDDGSLKIKYATFFPVAGSLTTFLGGAISIDTGTPVATDFTTLYAPNINKLSFAVLTDKLFIAQGASVYSISFAINQSGTVEFAVEKTLKPVLSPAQKMFSFTEIVAISVLKVAANEFYLAVGEAGSDTSTGRAVVFEGTDSTFADISQTFDVEGAIGEWFGWSVKLQLLDRDGAGSVNAPEPVLFVGAPKANSEVGTVKVFDISGGAIQTITPPTALTYVRAFGYSLAGGIHNTINNYLLVGAPASTNNSAQEGAAFVYKWNNEVGGAVGAYELKGIARPTAGSHGSVGSAASAHPSGSAWDADYSNHFGASVGYLNYHNWGPPSLCCEL